MDPIFATIFGGILVALVGASGVVYTARQGAKAARTASAVADRREIVEDYRTWAQDAQTRMERIEGELTRTRSRVDDLEKQRSTDQRVIRSALTYIRDLVAQIRGLGGDPIPAPAVLDVIADHHDGA